MRNYIAGLLTAAVLVGLYLLATSVLEKPKAPTFANDTPRTPQAQLAQARRTALRVWGRAPCHGRFSIARAALQSHQAGQATYNYTGGPETYSNCAIVIATTPFSYKTLCTTVTHEVGHLLGRKHSSNSRSVMYPRVGSHNVPQKCRQ